MSLRYFPPLKTDNVVQALLSDASVSDLSQSSLSRLESFCIYDRFQTLVTFGLYPVCQCFRCDERLRPPRNDEFVEMTIATHGLWSTVEWELIGVDYLANQRPRFVLPENAQALSLRSCGLWSRRPSERIRYLTGSCPIACEVGIGSISPVYSVLRTTQTITSTTTERV